MRIFYGNTDCECEKNITFFCFLVVMLIAKLVEFNNMQNQIKLSLLRYVRLRIFFSLLLLFVLFTAQAKLIHPIQYKQISTFNNLPTDEVQQVFQDRDGMMWFATRSGLCQYDGYKVTTYKSNLYTPFLLSNNNIYCIEDDGNHKIWMGTPDGINVLDKEKSTIQQYRVPAIPSNVVSAILRTRDNTLWIGTDWGLCLYNPDTDSFTVYEEELTGNIMGRPAVKALYEDKDGDIWIGTWSHGLYRYSPTINQFFAYPKFNLSNSAHVVFQDSNEQIWVGTWRSGLFRLDHAKDMSNVSFVNFTHTKGDQQSLSDDIVYAISEDLNTNTLWIGTRSGLSIMNNDTPGVFINYRSQNDDYHIPSDEVNSLMCDADRNMWVASIGGGVWMIDTHESLFTKQIVNLQNNDISTTAARSLLVDSDDNLWIGIGTYGLARLNHNNNKMVLQSDIPEFENRIMSSIYAMMQRRRCGDIWFGTYDDGIYIYRKGTKVRHLMAHNTPFIPSDIVYSLYEDRRSNIWIGTREGIGVSFYNGDSEVVKQFISQDGTLLTNPVIRDIIEDNDGTIWLATQNYGIIHITGDIRHAAQLTVSHYNVFNNKIKTSSAICLNVDRMGRLWVGTDGGGLFLYNREEDIFVEKNKQYTIPGDMVGVIEEDELGNLWLGTNAGLVQLNVSLNEENARVRVYTTVDGLSDNFFIPHSFTVRGDEMLFGSYRGYNSFTPSKIEEISKEVPFQITDIKIFNESLINLDSKLRQRISKLSPAFAKKIDLTYDINNFHIEFAALSYKNPELNQYAYKLVGFDKNWQYTDATRRFAYYNNLKPGKYKFQLKATNENGIWSGYIRELEIDIHPPFWATWWAYLIYIFIVCLLLYFLYYATKRRLLLRNELRLREMEQSKAEELNHVKLQFFTNITHELLTPLTIISATVDELKMLTPGHYELYSIISNNIGRLIRLLQQILEFRKAESGNLKLKVSLADISAFVRNAAESFRPLIKKRKIHFSVLCTPDSLMGYFDTDKLDKIIYNLLSNAAKYTNEDGFVQITLSKVDDDDYITLRIKDNGQGLSKEQQKDLFKRFYEGDYRKFNTIGTGIGLSLTKDLVDLHRGTIQVESKEGEGTEFIVKLPISASAYSTDQIDNQETASLQQSIAFEDTSDVSNEDDNEQQYSEKTDTLLLVEDNEELLQLMTRLLQRDYNIITANNGVEALKQLNINEIDLIVSDIMMPQMDGVELCKYVKSKLEISHIPIILLTAKNKEKDRADAYEIGADAFITKPFNLTVLHARIRNLLKYKERMAKDFKKQLVFEVKELNYTSIDEEFLQRAIDCVNRHLEDSEFDQLQFVEEMNTSKSTLYKKLKSLTGLNTSAFIRNIRMKAACTIMEEKGVTMRVSELAYAVGFNDPKYFSSCFKKEFSMLPSEYMERFIPEDQKKCQELVEL